jgi:hypothetical protein
LPTAQGGPRDPLLKFLKLQSSSLHNKQFEGNSHYREGVQSLPYESHSQSVRPSTHHK